MSETKDNKGKTGWIAGISAVAALLAALGVNQFFPDWVKRWTAEENYELQYHGFYREVHPSTSEALTHLRFYADGTVVSAPIQADANAGAVANWFNVDAPITSVGRYAISPQGKLEFETTSKVTGAEVAYTGYMKRGDLHLHSKANNGHESDASYTFIMTPGM